MIMHWRRFLTAALVMVAMALVTARAATGIKISALPSTNASPDSALLIVDQAISGHATNDTFSTTVSNLFSGRMGLRFTPVTVTQANTNLLVDLSLASYQLVTATNDLYVILTNAVAGANVLVDIIAGTTNRAISFSSVTNWFCAVPTTISSNHVMWLSFTCPTTDTNLVRASAVQTTP